MRIAFRQLENGKVTAVTFYDFMRHIKHFVGSEQHNCVTVRGCDKPFNFICDSRNIANISIVRKWYSITDIQQSIRTVIKR